MSFNFSMVGTLSLPKETEKFHPYEERVTETGWQMKTLRFSARCGDNTHILQVRSGNWADGHGDIFTSKVVDRKYEPLRVPFAERDKESWISQVASNRKFVIDLDMPTRREALEKAVEGLKTGKVFTDEELRAMGVKSEEDIPKAYEESKAKRMEYISEYDFIDSLKEIIEGSAYADKLFRITGSAEYSYSEQTQQWYENYVPNKVYLSSASEPSSTANFKLMFSSDSWDELSRDELNKIFIKGWHREYINTQTRKGQFNVPVSVVVYTKDVKEKKIDLIKKKFDVTGDKVYELSITVDMLNGSQRTKITEEDLTEEERDELECGLLSWSDIYRSHGNAVFGDRVKEFRFNKYAENKAPQETAFTVDDMQMPPLEEKEESLFDDDDI